MKYLERYNSFITKKDTILDKVISVNGDRIGDVKAEIFTDYTSLEEALFIQGADDVMSQLIEMGDDDLFPVCLLKNINAYKKGKGYGTTLYTEVVDFAYDHECNNILLVSDSGEQQENGFVLDMWYEKKGYEEIGEQNGNKIYIKSI